MDEGTPARRPQAEPEILPPERQPTGAANGGSRVFVSTASQGSERNYFVRPGPLTVIAAVLAIGIAAAALLVLLFGLVLIWLPVAGLVAAFLILSSLARAHLRRHR